MCVLRDFTLLYVVCNVYPCANSSRLSFQICVVSISSYNQLCNLIWLLQLSLPTQ